MNPSGDVGSSLWDREPAGRWRPSEPGMALKRVPEGTTHIPANGYHKFQMELRLLSLIKGLFLDFSDSVLTDRHDTGTFLLRHASRPSLARSVADFLSAHGPRRKVPVSRLGFVHFPIYSSRNICVP